MKKWINKKNGLKILQYKLKGGALYIAIIISIVIAVMLSMFIMLGSFNQRIITEFAQSNQLLMNLKSGEAIAQSAYFNNSNSWIKNTYNDDSIKISKTYWGAFLQIKVYTKNRHHSLSTSAFYGTHMSKDTGLVVADKSRPIGMAGVINFKANCYLPSAGIKPAFIEGQSYTGSSGNQIFIKKSPIEINQISSAFKEGIGNQMKGIDLITDSIVGVLPNILFNPFTNKTIVYQNSVSKLSKVQWSGNIKIIADNLEIDSTCKLNDILIIGSNVKFKEGFNGTLHVIASDSILAFKSCVFNYPSSFVLKPEGKVREGIGYVELSEDCVFNGGIIALSESKMSDKKVMVKLNASSKVNGFVYSSDYLHLQGEVNANVYAGSLLLKTPSAVYENHILSCEINPAKYSALISVPPVFDKNVKLSCCKRT